MVFHFRVLPPATLDLKCVFLLLAILCIILSGVFFLRGGLTIIIIPKTGFPGCSPNIPISPQGSGKFTCLCLLESGKILQHTISKEI